MTIGLFADKDYQPTETAVLAALGAKRALWEEPLWGICPACRRKKAAVQFQPMGSIA